MPTKVDVAAAFTYIVIGSSAFTIINSIGAYSGYPLLSKMTSLLPDAISRQKVVGTAAASAVVAYFPFILGNFLLILKTKKPDTILYNDLYDAATLLVKPLLFIDVFAAFFLPFFANLLVDSNYVSAIAAGLATGIGSFPILLFLSVMKLTHGCYQESQTTQSQAAPHPRHIVVNVYEHPPQGQFETHTPVLDHHETQGVSRSP